MAEFVTVASTADLAPGQGKVVEVGGVPVALFNVDGTFYALDNTCPHRGGPLGEGLLDGETVVCPWHGWQFNVKTGEHVVSARIKVKRYEVRVVGQEVQVRVG
ncbi:MAG TPA: non-heme iron oxygenase ferredoxin subunit [Thermodesulfobacteriota bacterium]|nr:non-heme iron oxygenase ferredoxin subunit [Thermodesulfobacteriota bacterium]